MRKRERKNGAKTLKKSEEIIIFLFSINFFQINVQRPRSKMFSMGINASIYTLWRKWISNVSLKGRSIITHFKPLRESKTKKN